MQLVSAPAIAKLKCMPFSQELCRSVNHHILESLRTPCLHGSVVIGETTTTAYWTSKRDLIQMVFSHVIIVLALRHRLDVSGKLAANNPSTNWLAFGAFSV